MLFQSAAKVCGRDTVAVLLTGMGADGANGLLELRNVGAHTIGQNEASCAVFGMPREATRLEAADRVEPLDRVAQTILDLCCM